MTCSWKEYEFPFETWKELNDEFDLEYMDELCSFLGAERKTGAVYPGKATVFRAFRETPLNRVKVVILGQDPYPNPGQATGLAFSVPSSLRPHPLSLRNIFHELQSDLGVSPPMSGDLTRWAHEGVLLLNQALTVRSREPNSHREGGWWTTFTRATIKLINAQCEPVVFLLWGAKARSMAALVTKPHHVILGAHPADRRDAANQFFGHKFFSRTNAFLVKHDRDTIAW